jgi:alginate O-acetyltransferase complex protein AlgI
LNLMVVLGLGGLWHGAALSYLMWGLLHGVLLVIERPFIPRLQSIDSTVFRAARISVVFVCVTMLWIFLKLPNFDHAISYLSGMFTPSTNPNPPKLFYNLALLYSLPVMIQHLVSRSLFERTLRGAEPYLYGLMAALMYLEAGPETSFIYFQF